MPRFNFFHGAGDSSNFAHQIPLYTVRGHSVEVCCTADKAILFRAAGATIVDNAPATHDWPHSPSPGRATVSDHWSGNKSAYNVSHWPMPDIGSYADLWQEYLDVDINLEQHCSQEDLALVESYISKLPRPLVVTHFQGNTGSDRKNLDHNQQADVLRGLIDRTDGAVINLDWDNRVYRLNNYRVRHLADDWQTLNLPQLYWLLRKADLLIAVDSGVLHFARTAKTPTIGVWTHHRPSHFVLPRPTLLNIVPASQTDLTRYRRLAYNLVECPGSSINGTFVAEQASAMLGTRKYVRNPVRDLVIQALVDKLRTNPNGTFQDRHRTIGRFLSYARKVAKPLIVETGCIRSEEDWTAGFSSYIFGAFLAEHGGELQSVDLDANNVRFAREWTTSLPVVVHEAHSHDWFRGYNGPKIDLLYLDSADVGTPNYQECCLVEAQLALPHLAPHAVILIDDSPWSCGKFLGKGGIAIPWLCSQGWTHDLSGYQTLLRRA